MLNKDGSGQHDSIMTSNWMGEDEGGGGDSLRFKYRVWERMWYFAAVLQAFFSALWAVLGDLRCCSELSVGMVECVFLCVCVNV